MRIRLTATCLMLVATCSVSIAATLSTRSTPTVGLPGFSTYIVSLTTDDGETLNGVDGIIQGPMNQVNPLGAATIFPTNNALFPAVGADPSQDSQFSLESPIAAIGARESDVELRAAFTSLQRLGLPSTADIFQIVTDRPEDTSYRLKFDLRNGTTETVDFSGCLVGVLCSGVVDRPSGGPGNFGPLDARVFATSEPAPGLPGFSTYTLFVESLNGAPIRGIGADFSGPLNQVNPFGVETIFTEANGAFDDVGAVVEQDSQFPFAIQDLESFARPSESESEMSLDMIFRRSDPQENPLPFAQVVTDDPSELTFDFTVVGTVSGRLDLVGSLASITIPEPSAGMLAIAFTLAASGRTNRRSRRT